MKAFKFTLQALRTLRLRQEHNAMENYARALLERARVADRLNALERELTLGCWEWQQRVTAGCTAAEMVHGQLHCRELAIKHNRGLTLAKEAERRADRALESMMLARQEREVVDTFFERQRAAYDRQLTRAEQKFLDELAHRRSDCIHAAGSEMHSTP
jgi:flagellar export protein FliJ